MGDLKKLSGRPQLEIGKRVKKIDVRFTEDEYNQVLALEKALGISKTDLFRMRVLNGAKQILVNSEDLIRQLDHIGAEMGRLGNNVNQLARHANGLNLRGALNAQVVVNFNGLMEAYIKSQQSLEVVLRKIIRTVNY